MFPYIPLIYIYIYQRYSPYIPNSPPPPPNNPIPKVACKRPSVSPLQEYQFPRQTSRDPNTSEMHVAPASIFGATRAVFVACFVDVLGLRVGDSPEPPEPQNSLGFRVSGIGFGVSVGFRVWGLGFSSGIGRRPLNPSSEPWHVCNLRALLKLKSLS